MVRILSGAVAAVHRGGLHPGANRSWKSGPIPTSLAASARCPLNLVVACVT